MQKNKNRKGLALGAMVSLVASMFVGVAPASANTGSVSILPLAGTSYSTIHGEKFSLKFVGDISKNLSMFVEKPASSNVSFTANGSSSAVALTTATVSRTLRFAAAAADYTYAYSTTELNTVVINAPTTASAYLSTSASVTVKVTIFEDKFLDGEFKTGDGEVGQTVTITWNPWSELKADVTLTTPVLGDTRVTASATLGSGINREQLAGKFYFRLGADTLATPASFSHPVSGADSDPSNAANTFLSGADVAAGRVLSASMVVPQMNTVSQSVSAQLLYEQDGNVGTAGAAYQPSDALAVAKTAQIAAKNYAGLTFSPVAGDNVARTAHDAADARINSAFAVRAFAFTGSGATLAAVATGTSLYFTVSPVIGANESITVHGRVVTASGNVATAALPLALTGATNIAISSEGLSAPRTLTLTLAKGNDTVTYTVTIEAPEFTATTVGEAFYATAPNTAVSVDLQVKDQFGVLSSRPLQRVSASALLGSTRSAAVTGAVVNGKVTLAINPTTGTNTGSATVSLVVEHQDVNTGVWSSTGNVSNTMTINVTSLANGFTASPDATASASISYALATGKYSWSPVAISGSTIVAGAVVTVAGAGLVFSADGGTTTASDSLTFRSGDKGKFFVFVAGTKAGEHVITFTAGSATATTTLTIDPAAANAGKTITVTGPATASPNRTLTYTGSVVDALGNPVADGDVTITVLGPVSLITGATGVTTDVDGEFTFRVQTAANDEGDISVTATYNKDAGRTLAKDKISAVALTTVALPVVVTADKVTVTGSATLTTGLSTDVVVTVVDADGKPLAGRNVSLRSSGPGFLNVQSAVSDTDGKVAVKFIATNQTGQVVITAVVDGKVGTHTLNVVAPVVVVPEINAVIGSFNGRWAVRVENAKGAVVSVKVGGNWFKFTSLNDNYLFSRVSTVGANLPIAVYVNGQLENVATITVQ